MKTFEFKLYGSEEQFSRIENVFRTVQFIRNKCISAWIAEGKLPKEERHFGRKEMYRMCAILNKQHVFCKELNSMAQQASAERAITAVSNFYLKCKSPSIKKKGYPKYQDNCRSVEYKTSGWKFTPDYRHIVFTDKTGIGTLALRGGYNINPALEEKIKRVRIIRKQYNYYLQLVVEISDVETSESTENAQAFDLGLKEFATDQNGKAIHNQRFLKKGLKKIKHLQRQVSRKKKGSKNRKKAVRKLAIAHGKIANQRKDCAVKIARCVVTSNDVVVFEDLNIKAMSKGFLARSVHDVGWGLFMKWVNHFVNKFGKTLILVDPAYTSQACSHCGCLPVEKIGLDVRTYRCAHCGLVMDRDQNAAINILRRAIAMVEKEIAAARHAESWSYILHCLNKAAQNAELQYVFGERASTPSGETDGASLLVEKETTKKLRLSKSPKIYLKSLEMV